MVMYKKLASVVRELSDMVHIEESDRLEAEIRKNLAGLGYEI
jgi:hypothetical protein